MSIKRRGHVVGILDVNKD